MPHHQFPTTYVYWETLKDHDILKSKYMPIIDQIEQRKDTPLKNPFNFCDINVTSFSDKNTFLSSDDIDEIIWKPIDNFIREINSTYNHKINIKTSILYNYWFNTYKMGDFQEFHNHHGGRDQHNNGKYFYPTFSGIYILHDDAETSSIIFKSPNATPQPFTDLTDHHVFYTRSENSIKEGSVVIFPSQLEHMVKKCIKPGRRTIAFNVSSNL